MASKNNSKAHPLIVLFIAAACYLSMAIAGMHFGLPDSGHNLSYNCDELNYIEVLSRLKPSEGKINPHPFFTHPTGYLLMNGTALLAMRAVGWIPKGDQEFFRLNPHLFARFYLVGRTLQVFFGLALLIAGWFVFRKIWGDSVASYTLLLLAVSPSFVATSHFSQANMPVALFMFFALAALWFGVSKGFAEKWLYFASYLNGLAISIKVSALAFFAPIAYYLYKSENRVRNALLAGVLIIAGFVTGDPFLLMDPEAFYKGLYYHVSSNQLPLPAFLPGLIYPGRVAYPHAMGWPLFLLALAGIVWALFQKKKPLVAVTLVWLVGFYLAAVRVGYIAASGRVLISLPAAILLAALFLDWLRTFPKWGKAASAALFFVVFILTAGHSLAILNLRFTYPIQKQTSDWITANISRDAVIGLPHNIYWWSPDVVYRSVHHPERQAKPYKVRDFYFSLPDIKKERPDYFIITAWENTMCNYDFPAEKCREFFDYFENSGAYSVAQEFPRAVEFAGWKWERKERVFNFDDDLWATSTKIYKRN